MNSALAIARREFRTFFDSPIAYIVLGGFLLLVGLAVLRHRSSSPGRRRCAPSSRLAPVLFVVLVPAVTMRSIAEERKRGTLELLLTMPLEDWQVVLGKFLAALAMVAVGLLCTLPYAFTVASLTAQGVSFDWGPVVGRLPGAVAAGLELHRAGPLGERAVEEPDRRLHRRPGALLRLLLHRQVRRPPPRARWRQVLEYLSVDYHFEQHRPRRARHPRPALLPLAHRGRAGAHHPLARRPRASEALP